MRADSAASRPAQVRRAVGAIVICESRFLLVHKVKAMDTLGSPVDIPGEWGFLLGGIKPGENPDVALRRELEEEANLTDYTIEKELPPFEFEFSMDHRHRSGYERQQTRMFLIKCVAFAAVGPTNQEIDKLRFFDHDEVPLTLHHSSAITYFKSLFETGVIRTH